MFMERKHSGYSTWTIHNNKIIIIEQYKNDFEARYMNVTGYLYKIKDVDNYFYKHPKSSFEQEYVCNNPIDFIKKYKILNVYNNIKKYVKIIRYDKIMKLAYKLLKQNKIVTFPKYTNENNNILYEGKHYLYTSIEQAVISKLLGLYVIPIFRGSKIMMIGTHKTTDKIKNLQINIYNKTKKLRQNIYHMQGDPIGSIKLSRNNIIDIIDKIYWINLNKI